MELSVRRGSMKIWLAGFRALLTLFFAAPVIGVAEEKVPRVPLAEDGNCEAVVRAATTGAGAETDHRRWRGMTVVLDTNVLLINPRAVFDFPGARVIIHNQVLRELDKKKRDKTENRTVAPNARKAARVIEDLQSGRTGDPKTNLLVLKQMGGVIVFDTNDYISKLPNDMTQGVLDPSDPDDRIIAAALYYDMQNRDSKGDTYDKKYGRGVVFISQDVQAKTKTRTKGVQSQEYSATSATREEINEEIYSGRGYVRVSPQVYEKLRGQLSVTRAELRQLMRLKLQESFDLYPNQYLVFVRPEDEEVVQYSKQNGKSGLSLDHLVGSYNAVTDSIEFLPTVDQLEIPIKPRNLEQRMLVHALMSKRIRQVTVLGKAGTGKTIFALMAGKEQSDQARRGTHRDFFKQMILMRTLDTVGQEDIGALPGTLEEKVGPMMESYYDNLQVLVEAERGRDRNGSARDKPAPGPGGSENSADKAVDRLMKSGQIKLQVMGFIRGRSIQKRFLVVDEAQNLDPGNVKTIVTRPGLGTKLILMGDIGQIDSPFLNVYNNGLTDLVNRIRRRWDKARENGEILSNPRLHLSAVVRLEQGERSELAEFMTELYESIEE